MAPIAGMALRTVGSSIARKAAMNVAAGFAGKKLADHFTDDHDDNEHDDRDRQRDDDMTSSQMNVSANAPLAGVSMTGSQMPSSAGTFPTSGYQPAGGFQTAGIGMPAQGYSASGQAPVAQMPAQTSVQAGGRTTTVEQPQQPSSGRAGRVAALGGAGLAAAGVAHETFSHQKDGGEGSGFKGQIMAALGGAASGAITKMRDEHDGSVWSKVKAAVTGGLEGGGAGYFAARAHDNIQKDGGGLEAGVDMAAANALTSRLKDDGPGFIKSATAGFGAGFAGNAVHDHLDESGHSRLADGLAASSMGGSLGYSLDGDKKSAGIGALGGAGLGAALGGGDNDYSDAEASLGGSSGTASAYESISQLASGLGDKEKDDNDRSFE